MAEPLSREHTAPSAAGSSLTRSGARFQSVFLERKLEGMGLGELMRNVQHGEPLTHGEACALLELSFPALGALIECRQCSRGGQHLTLPIAPAIALPFLQRLESLGTDEAIALSAAQVHKVRESHRVESELLLYIDRWKSSLPAAVVCAALRQLGERCLANGAVRLYGPSTGELRDLIGSAARPGEGRMPEEVAELLRSPLVTGIEGGSDHTLYALAADSGLPLFYAHSLLKTRLPAAASADERNDGASRPDGREFLDQLFELRETLLPTGRLAGWYPWSAVLLDRGVPRDAAPLGLELVRSVAIASLVLPEVPVIRAPVVLFGAKAAHLALFCGANDLGPVAVDLETATQTGLLHREDVVHEFFTGNVESLS